MPESYRIETDIPYEPSPPTPRGRKPLWPFAELEVGQSFFVRSEHAIFSHDEKLAAALYKARARTGFNLKPEPCEGGWRIFRVDGAWEPRPRQVVRPKRSARKRVTHRRMRARKSKRRIGRRR
jgi:hypothetical protein